MAASAEGGGAQNKKRHSLTEWRFEPNVKTEF